LNDIRMDQMAIEGREKGEQECQHYCVTWLTC
jgi:hypothetical protein